MPATYCWDSIDSIAFRLTNTSAASPYFYSLKNRTPHNAECECSVCTFMEGVYYDRDYRMTSSNELPPVLKTILPWEEV